MSASTQQLETSPVGQAYREGYAAGLEERTPLQVEVAKLAGVITHLVDVVEGLTGTVGHQGEQLGEVHRGVAQLEQHAASVADLVEGAAPMLEQLSASPVARMLGGLGLGGGDRDGGA